jgi:predicted acyltransferase
MTNDPEPRATSSPGRLASIDACRGLVMFLMMAEVLHLAGVAAAIPGSPLWETLGHHQSHVEWIGCSLHDLIQPGFSFLVGVSLPFSLANRAGRGQSRGRMILHACWRAFVLIALGIFLRSIGDDRTNYTFEDTLTQIGLGYPFLFLLGLRPQRDRWIAVAALLIGTWLAFVLYPAPGPDFDFAAVGVTPDWLSQHQLQGLQAHWNKNSNLSWAFDRWFLNLFPRDEPFLFNRGGYATLSFVPTLATMVLGLIAGQVLLSARSPRGKVAWMLVAGAVSMGLGWGLGELGICPIVKRIWTPSWVLFSGGWCFLFLGAAYGVIDGFGWKRWVFPLTVIGMNSIAAYLMSWLFEGFIGDAITRHLGEDSFRVLGEPYEPLLHGAAVLLVMWGLLFWMYRRRFFLKI